MMHILLSQIYHLVLEMHGIIYFHCMKMAQLIRQKYEQSSFEMLFL